MKTLLTASFLILFSTTIVLPQEKVAEGEYQMRWVGHPGTVETKMVSRWVLTASGSGGYELKSEIHGASGRMVTQVEKLTRNLIPTTIEYYFYEQAQNTTVGVVKCLFPKNSITCGIGDQHQTFAQSKPFKHRGPFWLYVVGWTDVDLPWLLGGAINMAHLNEGRIPVATVTVFADEGGDWDFHDDDKSPLEFVGPEKKEICRTMIATKRFTLMDGKTRNSFWIAGPGLVVEMSSENGDEGDFILVNYRQWKKLIPELPVEDSAGAPSRG